MAAAKEPDHQRKFMDNLESYMEQCYLFVEAQQQLLAPMTEEERVAKIQAITNLIKAKEKELSELETQRRLLNMAPTKSQASQRSKEPGSSCVRDCPAECSFSGEKVSRPPPCPGDASQRRP